MASECKHTAAFGRSIRYQGGLIYPNVAGKFVPRGWPDRTIVCPWGLITLLELKDETTRVRPEQKEHLAKLESMRAPAWVGRFMEDETMHHPLQFEDSKGRVITGPVPWSQFFDTVKYLTELR